MKSIIRLLLVCLSVVSMHSDLSALSLQKSQEIKSYIAAAQALGFSNEEVKAAFVKALENTDACGTVTLSLTNEHKRVALIAGGVTAVAALGGVVYLGCFKYNDGKIPFGKLWKNSEVNSVNPENPINPIDPVDPINLGNPIDPIDPVIDPINEMDPIDPVIDPINEMNPVDPIDPAIEPIAPEVIPPVGRFGATRYALRNTTRVNYKI